MGKKTKSPCRGDNRGGPWVGIPKVVVMSDAFRDLNVFARAVLLDILAEMDGYNNGRIGRSQRAIAASLGTTNFRRVINAIRDLVDHGFIEVKLEGEWVPRLAREYEITFVSTPRSAASNAYLHWTPHKIGDARSAAGEAPNDHTSSSATKNFDAAAAARIRRNRRKSGNTLKLV